MPSETNDNSASIEAIRDDAYKLTFPHVKVKDPLNEVTRRERRSLLGVSLAALVIVKVGLLPEEISAFGIRLASPDKGAMIHLLAYIVIFYLTAFLIYALSDFITWRLAFVAELRSLFKQVNDKGFDQNQDQRIRFLEHKWNLISTTTSVMRAVFEFLVPIGVAAYSIIVLRNVQV